MPVDEVSVEVTTLRWTEARLSHEVAFLRASSQAFRNLLNDVPSTLGGVNVNKVVVTDDPARFPSGKWESSEQVIFNPSHGIIYVGLNPTQTVRDIATGRVFSVGELIAHGLGHYTVRALDAAGSDPRVTTVQQEQVAVEYANAVGRDFGLSDVRAYNVGTWLYDPLYCTINQPQGGDRVPKFLSNCFPSGTSISVPGSRDVPIQDVCVGSCVLSFNPSQDRGLGYLVSSVVVRLFESITDRWLVLRACDDTSEQFETLTVTPGHHFLAADGSFRRVDAILAGDGRIVLADGSVIGVRGEEILYSTQTAHLYEEVEVVECLSTGQTALAAEVRKGWKTYNFEVEHFHTYIAGGVRVHNESVAVLSGDAVQFTDVFGHQFDGSQDDMRRMTNAIADGRIQARGDYVDALSDDRYTATFYDAIHNKIVVSADSLGWTASTVQNDKLDLVTRYDAGGQKTEADDWRPDLSHLDTKFDPSNTQPWSTRTTDYAPDGNVTADQTVNDDGTSSLRTNNTDGTHAITTETLDGAAAAASVLRLYDATDRLVSETFRNDDGGTKLVSYDAAGTHPWLTQTAFFGLDHNLRSEEINYDDGRQSVRVNDVDGAQNWVSQYTLFNAAHLVARQDTFNDDGTSIATVNDLAGVQPWASRTELLDGFGRVTQQTEIGDDQLRSVQVNDVDGLQGWTSIKTIYTGNQVLEQDVVNDDQTATTTINDLTGAQTWLSRTETFDALNRVAKPVYRASRRWRGQDRRTLSEPGSGARGSASGSTTSRPPRLCDIAPRGGRGRAHNSPSSKNTGVHRSG